MLAIRKHPDMILDGIRSTSRLSSRAPSIRVDDPTLSMVATQRSADSLSGAMRPMARQAPLNSSTSAISERSLHLSIHFHPILDEQA
jgi:hypothetical protein